MSFHLLSTGIVAARVGVDQREVFSCVACVQIKQEQREHQHDAVAGTMKRYHQHEERKKNSAQLHFRVHVHPVILTDCLPSVVVYPVAGYL